MAYLIDRLRARQQELRDASAPLLEQLSPNERELVAAMVAQVSVEHLEHLAGFLEYLDMQMSANPLSRARRTAADRNRAIRVAAAAGDWDEFDRLLERVAGGSGHPPGTRGGSPTTAQDDRHSEQS